MQANGKSGTVEFADGAVTIHRKGSVGWRATTGAVETRIPVQDIVAIQLKAAGILGTGTIHFVAAETNDRKRSEAESAVAFTHRQNASFEALAREVARELAERRRVVA